MSIAAWEHPEERELLRVAFSSFDQAAKTLQLSYDALTVRVKQMDLELARSNDALRRQLFDNEAMRAHLDGILESLSTGVLVVSETDVISRSNKAADTLLGEVGGVLRGRQAAEVLTTVGLTVCERPQRIGQTVVTITQVALQKESGCSSGRLILIQDVTRMCQLEEQLQRKDRLTAMGELIGRIAHEIRNPLGSVELFASMLQRDLIEHPSAKRYAEQISQAVHSMDQLLTNLLMYTRPARTARVWCRAESLVEESLILAAHAIHNASAEIRLDLDPGIPFIWCHEGQMKQVLLNLVVNAMQAMPHGGAVTISLHSESQEVLGGPAIRLTVGDAGVGIEPTHRSRIFDPFFTTKEEGTGLGLAIVHSLVEAHQGRIDVASTVGKGTACTIILPHPSPVQAVDQVLSSTHLEGETAPAESVATELALTEEWTHER